MFDVCTQIRLHFFSVSSSTTKINDFSRPRFKSKRTTIFSRIVRNNFQSVNATKSIWETIDVKTCK